MDNGHILELRERKEYKKPTTIRREQKLKAIRKNKYNRDNIN
jgi:ribosomal protein S21